MTEPDEAALQTSTARTRWLDPAWLATVHAWIEDELGRRGLRVTGRVEQSHIRPWSTVMTVPTSGGPVWFKASGPGSRFEARLMEAFVRWGTKRVLEPMAVDLERDWLLLPDGGTRLRDTLDGGPGIDAWLRILPEWGAMQRELESRAAELIALGVPDARPARVPDDMEALLADPSTELGDDDRTRLRRLVPAIARACPELESMGIAASLQHDDLHDANVFVGEGGDRIFDWGDASVAHPFGTLLVTFRSIASHGLEGRDDERRVLERLRDAYLEPWTDEHARSVLNAAVPLAMRAAIVGRALSWKRALVGIPADDQGEWTGNVGGWLLDLFEPLPV